MAIDVIPRPATRRATPGPKPRRRAGSRNNLAGYLFMTPWLLGFVFIVGGPVLVSLYLSFTDYSLLGSPEWVGWDNYVQMFTTDDRFFASLKVTVTYLVVSVPLVQVFALALATILNRGVRGLAIYRTVYYIPSLIGGSVAIAILWRFVFGGDGLLNGFLRVLGVETSTSWIGSPDTALYTLVVLNVWQFGAAMIIYLAGLRQVPDGLHEAAKIDGASAIRRFWHITLPMLSPVILFNVLMNMVGAFQAFNSAYIVSNGTGGPADSTLFYTLYLYQRGFVDFDMGYASALGWFLLVVVGLAALGLFGLSRRLVFYAEES
jgi:multiple sugar transport system permease protein